MKRLILFLLIPLLCSFSTPPTLVVYGLDHFQPLYDGYGGFGRAQQQFYDFVAEADSIDWWGYGVYRVEMDGFQLYGVEGASSLCVISILRGHSYIEDEIHAAMKEQPSALYTFRYTSIPADVLTDLLVQCEAEVNALSFWDEEGELIADSAGVVATAREPKVRIEVSGDLKKFLGWKLYLKYLFHPYIRLVELPFANTELASSAD